MKQAIGIFILALLTTSFMSCSEEEKEELNTSFSKFVGSWKLVNRSFIGYNDEVSSSKDYDTDEDGEPYVYTFKDDGTFSSSSNVVNLSFDSLSPGEYFSVFGDDLMGIKRNLEAKMLNFNYKFDNNDKKLVLKHTYGESKTVSYEFESYTE